MKIFLINPRRRVVEEVEYDNSIETMYKLLGHGCYEFQAIVINMQRDMVYIDANARNQGNREYNLALDMWQHKRYRGPLVGNGLVIGTDNNGDSITPHLSISDLATEIIWRKT